MIEFAYNNVTNSNTSHILFEFNCGYYLKVSFEEDVDSYLRFYFVDKLVKELKKLIKVCCQNLVHT